MLPQILSPRSAARWSPCTGKRRVPQRDRTGTASLRRGQVKMFSHPLPPMLARCESMLTGAWRAGLTLDGGADSNRWSTREQANCWRSAGQRPDPRHRAIGALRQGRLSCLHPDLYGEITSVHDDVPALATGGGFLRREFILPNSCAVAASVEIVRMKQCDAVIFPPVRARCNPAAASRGRAVRHGVSVVRPGQRYTWHPVPRMPSSRGGKRFIPRH